MKDKFHRTFILSFLEHARQYHGYPHHLPRDEMHRLWMHRLRSHQCAGLPAGVVHDLCPRWSDTLARAVGQDRGRSRGARQLASWSCFHPPGCLAAVLIHLCCWTFKLRTIIGTVSTDRLYSGCIACESTSSGPMRTRSASWNHGQRQPPLQIPRTIFWCMKFLPWLGRFRNSTQTDVFRPLANLFETASSNPPHKMGLLRYGK